MASASEAKPEIAGFYGRASLLQAYSDRSLMFLGETVHDVEVEEFDIVRDCKNRDKAAGYHIRTLQQYP
jgi:hypothetical protein